MFSKIEAKGCFGNFQTFFIFTYHYFVETQTNTENRKYVVGVSLLCTIFPLFVFQFFPNALQRHISQKAKQKHAFRTTSMVSSY